MQGVMMTMMLLAAGTVAAQSDPEKEVMAVAQRLFDAMAAKDAVAARSVALPEAHHVAVRADGRVTVSTHEQFAARLAESKGRWLERMWSPKVLIRGALAEIWAPYDFHLDGKFSHCGIDSFHLVKTADGWKISEISYTMETTGCEERPPGAPK